MLKEPVKVPSFGAPIAHDDASAICTKAGWNRYNKLREQNLRTQAPSLSTRVHHATPASPAIEVLDKRTAPGG